jgi:hypothetical protein
VDLSSVPFGWEEEGGHSEEDDVDDTAERDNDDDDARTGASLKMERRLTLSNVRSFEGL